MTTTSRSSLAVSYLRDAERRLQLRRLVAEHGLQPVERGQEARLDRDDGAVHARLADGFALVGLTGSTRGGNPRPGRT